MDFVDLVAFGKDHYNKRVKCVLQESVRHNSILISGGIQNCPCIVDNTQLYRGYR